MSGYPHYCHEMGHLLPAPCLIAFLIDYFPCVRLCFNIINCFHCDFWFVIESKALSVTQHNNILVPPFLRIIPKLIR